MDTVKLRNKQRDRDIERQRNRDAEMQRLRDRMTE